MSKLPNGLAEWLYWIATLKGWLLDKPIGLVPIEWHEVEGVSYRDLVDLADHFETEVIPENFSHRKSVEIDLDKDNTLVFFSKPRGLTYDNIEEDETI